MYPINNKIAAAVISATIALLVVGIGFSFNTYYVQPRKEAATASTTASYTCASSTSATVVYDDTKGKPSHAAFTSQTYSTGPLPKVASTTTAIYSNGEFIWWRKGKSGFLTVDNKEGTVLVSDCVEGAQ